MDFEHKQIDAKDVRLKEIYRYLGYHNIEPNELVDRLVNEVLSDLFKLTHPRCLYKKYNVTVEGNNIKLYNLINNSLEMDINSRNLADNLRGCSLGIVMAATLGLEADKLLQKYEIINMTKASISQACGAAYIENYCDKLQEMIRVEAEADGLYIRPRFSPGYGDLPLDTQKQIFQSLECSKRLGLTLTDSMLMYPTKSVTAFIGVTKDKQNCHIKKCNQCDNKECEYRYED